LVESYKRFLQKTSSLKNKYSFKQGEQANLLVNAIMQSQHFLMKLQQEELYQ
jgi:hypothetical protein